MKFKTYSESKYYRNRHAKPFRDKLAIVKCRVKPIDGKPYDCYTVVMK